jgi:hypothetical protein
VLASGFNVNLDLETRNDAMPPGSPVLGVCGVIAMMDVASGRPRLLDDNPRDVTRGVNGGTIGGGTIDGTTTRTDAGEVMTRRVVGVGDWARPPTDDTRADFTTAEECRAATIVDAWLLVALAVLGGSGRFAVSSSFSSSSSSWSSSSFLAFSVTSHSLRFLGIFEFRSTICMTIPNKPNTPDNAPESCDNTVAASEMSVWVTTKMLSALEKLN